MRKIFLTLALVFTISITAFANPAKDKKTPRGGGHFMKELNLTSEQQEQMKALRQDFQKKQKDLATSYNEDFQQILTPEQQIKLNELREKRRSERGAERHRMAHKGKKHRGAEKNLDKETVASLKSLKENYLQEKKMIEMSRIAPDVQKEQISELTKKYRTDKRELIHNAKKEGRTKSNS